MSILEQAAFIDELYATGCLSVAEMAKELSRSKAWVSMRLGLISEMSATIRAKLFDRITAYIANDNPKAADQFGYRLIARAELLGAFPQRGPAYCCWSWGLLAREERDRQASL